VSVRNRDIVRITVVVAATLFGLSLLYTLREVLLLAGVALFLAVAMEPSVTFVQRFVKARGAAVALVLLAVFLAIGGFVASVVPPISNQVQNLVENLPEYSRQIKDQNTPIGQLFARYDIPQKIEEGIGDASKFVGGIGSVFGRIASAITNLLVVSVLTIYFLLNAPRMRKEGLRLVPAARRARVGTIVDQVFAKVGGWMEGNILISVIAGIVSFVVLFLTGVPYAHALAMWVAITDLIPMIGAMIGAGVSVAVAFLAGSTAQGVITLVFFLAYQQIENYVVSPRVMKRTVDVSAITVILAALAGGTLLGPIGVLLAVPGAASVKVVLNEVMQPGRRPKPGRRESEEQLEAAERKKIEASPPAPPDD
jgi:predicted PurR-regulated permease PerM